MDRGKLNKFVNELGIGPKMPEEMPQMVTGFTRPENGFGTVKIDLSFYAVASLDEVKKASGGASPVGRTFTFKIVQDGKEYTYVGVTAIVREDRVHFSADAPWSVVTL